jgi:hypothetical protein
MSDKLAPVSRGRRRLVSWNLWSWYFRPPRESGMFIPVITIYAFINHFLDSQPRSCKPCASKLKHLSEQISRAEGRKPKPTHRHEATAPKKAGQGASSSHATGSGINTQSTASSSGVVRILSDSHPVKSGSSANKSPIKLLTSKLSHLF